MSAASWRAPGVLVAIASVVVASVGVLIAWLSFDRTSNPPQAVNPDAKLQAQAAEARKEANEAEVRAAKARLKTAEAEERAAKARRIGPEPKVDVEGLIVPDCDIHIAGKNSLAEFYGFLIDNLGKLVHANVNVELAMVQVDPNLDGITFDGPKDCDSCVPDFYLSSDEGFVGMRGGTHHFSGYFMVDEDIQREQMDSFTWEPLKPKEVVLRHPQRKLKHSCQSDPNEQAATERWECETYWQSVKDGVMPKDSVPEECQEL